MVSVVLRPGERNGGVAVVLRGELEVAGAAGAAAVVPAGGACRHEIIAGLAGLEFISCSGLRVLQHVRMLPPGGRASSPPLGLRAGLLPECAGRLGGTGGRP
jgi:hypothetical protein